MNENPCACGYTGCFYIDPPKRDVAACNRCGKYLTKQDMETKPNTHQTSKAEGRNMITKCDMCGSQIVENKCECGEWISKEEMDSCPMRMGLDKFHEMKRFTLTGDAPHLGCAVVYFRGDYTDTKKVEKFIHEMKKRPHYQDQET